MSYGNLNLYKERRVPAMITISVNMKDFSLYCSNIFIIDCLKQNNNNNNNNNTTLWIYSIYRNKIAQGRAEWKYKVLTLYVKWLLESRLWYVKNDTTNTKTAMKIMQQRITADNPIEIKWNHKYSFYPKEDRKKSKQSMME